jgi:ABC-2 type transport system permease protein
MSLLTSSILLVIQYFAFGAIFRAKPAVGNFSWSDARTYILLTFVLSGLIATDYERNLHSSISQGSVANELIRTIDFQSAQLAVASGTALTELVARVLVAAVLGKFVLETRLPASGSAGALFVVSMLLGFFLRFLVTYIVGLCCFFLLNVFGLSRLRQAFTSVLSGAIVPLAMLPHALADIARASPFPGMLFVPASIYIGHLDGAAAARAVGVQLVWVVLLWVGARAMWRFCMTRYIVQGG